MIGHPGEGVQHKAAAIGALEARTVTAMKLLSSSWLLSLVLFGVGAGCAVTPESGAGDEGTQTVETSEEALGAATLAACLPARADLGSGGICNGRGTVRFDDELCCSGRARETCFSRGEPSELFCL